MNISIYFEEAAQVSVAFIIGAVIVLERGFKSKPAGFRTMILICVGSCVYTILSYRCMKFTKEIMMPFICTGSARPTEIMIW